MARRVTVVVLAGLGLLAAALGAAVVFRAPLLETALERGLRARGVPAAQLTVANAGLGGARITDLRLGAQDELAARSLRVAYTPAGLLAGRIDALRIDGLAVRLDLSGEGPPFGSLQALFAGDGAGAAPPRLPPITLSDGRLAATSPVGPINATLEGAVQSGADGALTVLLAFDLEGGPGRLSGTLRASRAPEGRVSGTLGLDDGIIELPGADLRGVHGTASFAWRDGRPERIEGAFTLGRVALPEAAFQEARVSLEATQTRLDLEAHMGTADGQLTVDLGARLDDYLGTPDLALEASAQAGAESLLWPLLALPAPGAGRVALSLRAAGRLPPLAELADRPAADLPGLVEDGLDGRLELALSELSYAERVTGLSGALALEGGYRAGRLELALIEDARLAAAQVAPAWLGALGLPTELAAVLADGAELGVPAAGEHPFRVALSARDDGLDLALRGALRLAGAGGAGAEAAAEGTLSLDPAGALLALALDPLELAARNLPLGPARLTSAEARGRLSGPVERLEGELDLTLALAGPRLEALRAEAASAKLPLAVARAGETLSLRLRGPGELRLRGLAYGDRVRAEAPVVVTLGSGQVEVTRPETGPVSWAHDLSAGARDLRLSLRRAEGQPIPLVGRIERARVTGGTQPAGGYAGRAEITGAHVTAPESGLALDGLRGRLALESASSLRFAVPAATLRHTGEPPLFAPLALEGQAQRRGDEVTFSAQARGPAEAGPLRLSGRHALAAGRGELRLDAPALAFTEDGVQPGALAPALADLRAVTGTVSGGARLAWSGGEAEGEADLNLDGLSFDSDEARVEGLSLGLHLDRLAPPHSPAGQRLTVRRIDPGLPLTDLAVVFQVLGGAPARLAVESAQLFLSGGRFLVRDVLIDPATPAQRLTLEVEELDLAQLFGLLDVAGLSGEGRLSGRIPVHLEKGGVRLVEGELSALGPGVIRLKSEQAAQVLAGAGESADLMLRALEDFHYDELSLTIDKPATGEARLGLVMLGRNPGVLNGYPFRFNINLETNPDRLLGALREAYRLSNRLLRQLWMPGG